MYVIDGHNLIPKIPGVSLSDVDDEEQLIQLLVSFCQRTRSRVTLFFDKADLGRQRCVRSGSVAIYFVPKCSSADNAIHAFLIAHKGEAPNFKVVSSDRQVQRDARALHARVMTSEAFAEMLHRSMEKTNVKEVGQVEKELTQEEIAEWERLFKGHNNSCN